MYQKIVVPLDGSQLAECVLPHVEAISQGCGVKEVVLFRVVPPLEQMSTDYLGAEAVELIHATGSTSRVRDMGLYLSVADIERIHEAAKKNAQNYLNELKGKLDWHGVSIKAKIGVGPAAETIADYVTKNHVDLVVIATHGRSGVSRFVWGSVADRLLRSVCAPILMVRAPGCVPSV